MSALDDQNLEQSARLSVAPMMAWTDRHCRVFHRMISRQVLLYTEMVTAPALVLGGALRLLDFSPEEQPVALQLGGSDPAQLAKATALGAAHGYGEINLNLGCPSDRVQSGRFGAVLMTEPDLVRACLERMQEASTAEVTVKCRHFTVTSAVLASCIRSRQARTRSGSVIKTAPNRPDCTRSEGHPRLRLISP